MGRKGRKERVGGRRTGISREIEAAMAMSIVIPIFMLAHTEKKRLAFYTARIKGLAQRGGARRSGAIADFCMTPALAVVAVMAVVVV